MRDLFSILGETVLRESGADKPTGFFKMRRFRDIFRIHTKRKYTHFLGDNKAFRLLQGVVMVAYAAFLILSFIVAGVFIALIVQDGLTLKRIFFVLPPIIWATIYYLLFRNEDE